MTFLRILFVALFLVLTVYTIIVVGKDGMTLIPVFFGDILSVTWPGQFNLDFMTYLILSALWVAWRHAFSLPGLVLASIALVGGMLFLSLYLLFATMHSDGDIRMLLLGKNAH